MAGTCIALHRTTTVSQAACLDLSSATHALLYVGLRRLSVGIICEKFVYVKFAAAVAAAVDVLFYLCAVALFRFFCVKIQLQDGRTNSSHGRRSA